MRVLLVEDSVALADELLPLLARSGYAVDWVVDGRDASVRASDENYDVAVLDLGLPGRNGLEVLRDWRSAGLPLAVLVLTARDSFADRIAGLRAGATARPMRRGSWSARSRWTSNASSWSATARRWR